MRRILPGKTTGMGLSCEQHRERRAPFLRMDPVEGRCIAKTTAFEDLLRTRYAAAIQRVLTAFKGHAVGAILAELGTIGCALGRVRVKMGLRLLVVFHRHDAMVMPKRRMIRFAYRKLARDAGAFVSGSQHFRRVPVDIGFPKEKVFIVQCGLELEECSAAMSRDGRLVLAVGRLSEKKGPELFIRAFASARRDHQHLTLEMIWKASLRKTCDALVHELGLAGNFVMHGSREHAFVEEKFAAAGMSAQHSVTAADGDISRGISLVEVVAACRPAVRADHNSFSETVSHEETCLLSPEEVEQAMAASSAVLAGDDAWRIVYGRNGRERAEAVFDAVVAAARLRDLLFAETPPAGARA